MVFCVCRRIGAEKKRNVGNWFYFYSLHRHLVKRVMGDVCEYAIFLQDEESRCGGC
jgi:hypothetical protein